MAVDFLCWFIFSEESLHITAIIWITNRRSWLAKSICSFESCHVFIKCNKIKYIWNKKCSRLVCIMTSIYCWPLGVSYLGSSLWDVAWIILCCLTCIILHWDCLRPGLVADGNEVTYGKWFPDIVAIKWFIYFFFSSPFGCLHVAIHFTGQLHLCILIYFADMHTSDFWQYNSTW